MILKKRKIATSIRKLLDARGDDCDNKVLQDIRELLSQILLVLLKKPLP